MTTTVQALAAVDLIGRLRLDALLDHPTQEFLDVATIGEYARSIGECLDQPEFPHHRELVRHFDTELRIALDRREPPVVAAALLDLAADRWEEGTCHVWDRSVAIGARDSTIDRLVVTALDAADATQIVVTVVPTRPFRHRGMACELASVLRSVEAALAAEDGCVDTLSIEPRMHSNAIAVRSVTSNAALKVAARLAALGWRIELADLLLC